MGEIYLYANYIVVVVGKSVVAMCQGLVLNDRHPGNLG